MAYEKKEGEASVFLRKQEYTLKADKGKLKKGDKDFFWVGELFIGTNKYDVSTSGKIIQPKEVGKSETLIINVKRAKDNGNRL